MSKATSQGYNVEFGDDACYKIVIKIWLHMRFKKLDSMKSSTPLLLQQVHVATSGNCIDHANLWHQHLGHLGIDILKLLAKQDLVGGLSIKKDAKLKFCEGCMVGKQHREPFPKQGGIGATKVHCDILGLSETNSFGGVGYFVTFINHYYRKKFCYFL
jgi:hypothetical protein